MYSPSSVGADKNSMDAPDWNRLQPTMLPANPEQHPYQYSTSVTPQHRGPELNELDELLGELRPMWEQEIKNSANQSFTYFDVEPLLRQPKPAVRDLRIGRRRRRRGTETLKAPRSLPQFNLKLPALNHKVLVAGLAVAGVGLSMGSVSAWQHLNKPAQPPIRKVMYQNVEAKVAAFRKEVSEGNHVIPDDGTPIQYVVKKGDTVNKLSQRFHLKPNTIIKNNDPKKLKAQGITPGTKLTILPVDGISHPVQKNETIEEISKRYRVDVKEILNVNEIENPHFIVEKQSLIIPKATNLKFRPTPKPPAPKTEAKKGFLSRYFGGEEPEQVKGRNGRGMFWPSGAGTITSNFGWRWFRMHNGMDIAAPVGTQIRAARDGVVSYAGWMGGYGYAIDINHGNGITTRYAHCSELGVHVGQRVYAGQLIAAMGNTGRSTGPHLHFEVHVNGVAVNPRSYF